MNVFEKRVRSVFRGYTFETYRECAPGFEGPFVEFWLIDTNYPNSTYIKLKHLQQLAMIFDTENIDVTGGTEEQKECGCGRDESRIYVLAKDVKFSAAKKKARK